MNDKQKAALKDALTMLILLAFMFFMVKGVPKLMGGATDANGNPLTISNPTVVEMVVE